MTLMVFIWFYAFDSVATLRATHVQQKGLTCPTGGISHSICSLSLSTKIGLTIIITGLAWFILVASVVCFLREPRRYALPAVGSLFGMATALSSLILWW